MYYPNQPPYYQPPYKQTYQPSYPPQNNFYAFDTERHELRKTSSGLGWTLLISLGVMILLEIIMTIFLKVIGYPFGNAGVFGGMSPIMYFLQIGMSYSLFLFVPFAFYVKIRKLQFVDILPFQRVSIGVAFCCILMGVAVCMLSNLPANWVVNILKSLGFSGEVPSYPKTENLYANILYAINTMIIPPLVEEFVFRGVILGSLRKFGDGIAIFGSALLFGLFHGNFIQMPFAFLSGLIFAFIIVRTGNLWITVIIHAINNGLSLASEFLSRSMGEKAVDQIYGFVFLALVVLGLLGMLLLNYLKKDFLKTHKPEKPLIPFSYRVRAFLGNPGIIFAALFCIGEAVFILLKY